jgi:hypothetical protein
VGFLIVSNLPNFVDDRKTRSRLHFSASHFISADGLATHTYFMTFEFLLIEHLVFEKLHRVSFNTIRDSNSIHIAVIVPGF